MINTMLLFLSYYAIMILNNFLSTLHSFTQNGITDRGGCRLAELAEVTPSLQQMR